MDDLLDELRALIEASGLTRYRLSKLTEISQGQLADLMAGRKGVSIESLARLVDALDHTIRLLPKNAPRPRPAAPKKAAPRKKGR